MEQKFSLANVESCYQLAAGNFGRGWLKQGEPGLAVAWKKHGFIPVSFRIKADKVPALVLKYPVGENAFSQEVRIKTSPTIFGQRPYLSCSCGRKGSLYLRPGISFWQCRVCLNLRYGLQRINKRTYLGILLYYLNRHLKIEWLALKIKRVKYRGKATRRARSLVNSRRKWGLDMSKRARIEELKPQTSLKI